MDCPTFSIPPNASQAYVQSALMDLVRRVYQLELARITAIIGAVGPAGADGTDGTDGDDGTDGTNGSDGAPGAEIELQKSATYIQWRYVGDATWINLVALSDLKGADGTNGTNGVDGTDGADGAPGADGTGFPDAPMDNKLYGRKDATWEEVVVPTGGGGGGGKYTFVSETVLTSPSAVVQFTGLDLDNEYEYLLDMALNGPPTTNYIQLFYNGDTVGDSTYSRTYRQGTTISNTGTSGAHLGQVPVGLIGFMNLRIQKRPGSYPVAYVESLLMTLNGNIQEYDGKHVRKRTENVTSFAIRCDAALKVGSSFRLYKLTK